MNIELSQIRSRVKLEPMNNNYNNVIWPTYLLFTTSCSYSLKKEWNISPFFLRMALKLSSSWPWPWPTRSLTWLTWSPTQPNIALIDLVTNLTKPSLDLGKIWARGRHYNQTDHPTTTTKLFKGGNLEFLLSDCSESQRGELDWYYDQTGPPPPPPPPPPLNF